MLDVYLHSVLKLNLRLQSILMSTDKKADLEKTNNSELIRNVISELLNSDEFKLLLQTCIGNALQSELKTYINKTTIWNKPRKTPLQNK